MTNSYNSMNTRERHDGEYKNTKVEIDENHKFPKYLSLLYLCFAIITITIQWPQPKLEIDPYVPYMINGIKNSGVHGTNISDPLSGTNIVITGSTSGIGLGLTIKLFDLGAHVIAIGRSSSKLKALEKELNSRRPKGMTSVVADFDDLDQVALASKVISKKFKRIDFLINNAGIHHSTIADDAKTEQGYEATFGINYMSHFLLTKKLLPLLRKSRRAHPKIVQISSTYHIQVDGFDLKPGMSTTETRNELQISKHNYLLPPLAAVHQGFFAYANSKLAQILHARALSRTLNNENPNNKIHVVSVCPTWVGTNIPRRASMAYLLSLLAFDRDNYGLATMFHAMFHPDAGANDETDFIVSAKIPMWNYSFTSVFGSRWMTKLYIRQIIVDLQAFSLLIFQKFFAATSFARSSKESYNIDLQDKFYEWSEEAIAPWM